MGGARARRGVREGGEGFGAAWGLGFRVSGFGLQASGLGLTGLGSCSCVFVWCVRGLFCLGPSTGT